MKLADLFVAIGIEVQGKDKLDDTEKSLKRMTADAGKVAAGLSAISAAFLAIANAAGQAAMAMKAFALDTDLGVGELQKWEYAAQVNGVAANHLRGTILALQKQQAQIALGEGDISGFQFFGINPNENNPFQVLAKVREQLRLIGDDARMVAIARERAGALGISDDVFQFLRLSNPELEKQLELTESEVVALAKMQMEWTKVRLAIVAVGQKFVAALAQPLQKFWQMMKGVIDRFALFVAWLNKGSTAANVVRGVLATIALIIGTLTVLFVGLTAALAAATAAMFALDLAASPVVLIILAIAAALALGVAQILLYVAIWDDLMVALEGGDAILTPIVKKWKEWADAIKKAYDMIKEFTGFADKDKRQNFFASAKFVWDNSLKDSLKNMFTPEQSPTGDMIARALNPVPSAAGVVSNNNETKIDVHVDGSGDPRATGSAVVYSLKQAVSDASFQQPAPAY